MFKRFSEDKGFTLIELLVVILIIGILAAIALPNFLGQTDRAHRADAKSAVRSVFLTAKTYATDNSGVYPAGTQIATQIVDDEPAYTVVGADTATAADPATSTSAGKPLVNVASVGDRSVEIKNKAADDDGTVFSLTDANGTVTRTTDNADVPTW